MRSFSDDEIEVIRRVARKLKAEKEWSSARLGEAIGIAQQNASRFVAANSTSGMDRVTANSLAVVAGYRDVEHLLLEAGVLAEMEEAPGGTPWKARDVAVSIARKMGYPDVAILGVIHRFTGPEHVHKGLRWWNDMIVLEALARANDPEPVSPPTKSDAPRRKRSGTEG